MHRSRPALAVALALMSPWPTSAQSPGATGANPPFDEVQATIRRMQEKLERLGSAASERDQALQFLQQQVEQATGEIAGTGKTYDALRGEAATLADKVQDLSADREKLRGEVGTRDEAMASLETRLSTLAEEFRAASEREAMLLSKVAAMEVAAGKTHADLATKAAEAETLQQRVAELEADAGRNSALAVERGTELERLNHALTAAQQAAEETKRKAAIQVAATEGAAAALRRQVESLGQDVTELNDQLAAAETTVDQQRQQIDGLDSRLSAALAQRVEELEQYRSEFFGQLKQALGDRPDLRVVGDRFVFQSELLFDSGSAQLDPEGQAELRALARTLQDVAGRIPPQIDWVLRVDGHTDKRPIRDSTFHSNWELSTARAISVIQFLVAQGIPPEHLAAAGFGEYRPIDPADDEIAYRRNRRIEFKLTEG